MSEPFSLGYDASPTCAAFLKSRAPRKILSGPVGGGKTSACVIHALLNAMQQEPDDDGIRRTRHIFIRNTIAQLRQTTVKSMLDWLPERVFGRYLTTQKEYYLKFQDVEAEIIMLALEDETDLRRLLSLEATTIYINEAKEISQTVLEGIVGAKRVGRYPSRKSGPGATYPCIIADTNMPNFGSYHQRVMDGEEGDWETFKQPGGRTPEAENLEFLPPDYYSTEGLTEEHIRVFIDCLYGTSKDGLPVFKDTFLPDFHVAKESLRAVTSSEYPLVIGLDAGLTPAAIIGQQTPSGKINILAECYTPKGESIGMERFLLTKLTPMLTRKFPGVNAIVIVDPAAMQRSQANEETVFEIVKKAGYKVYPAPSNKIDLRIGSAETLFGQQMGGKAVLQIDSSCTGLISALGNGYSYAIKKDGEVEDKPAKLHPVSDLCFVAGTLVLSAGRGWVPIESIAVGEKVVVPGGEAEVTHIGNRVAEKVVGVELTNGKIIVCTPEHPFATKTSCFLPADELYSGLELIEPEAKWGLQRKNAGQRQRWSLGYVIHAARSILLRSGESTRGGEKTAQRNAATRQNAATGRYSTDYGLVSTVKTSTTGINEGTKLACRSTNIHGRSSTGLPPLATKSTTKTETQGIIALKISKPWIVQSILGCIYYVGSKTVLSILLRLSKKLEKLQKRGTGRQKAENGIESMLSKSPLSVVRVASMSGGRRVYNLTVSGQHVYYADGVLVHNCDGFTYLTLYLAGPIKLRSRPVEPVKIVSLAGWV